MTKPKPKLHMTLESVQPKQPDGLGLYRCENLECPLRHGIEERAPIEPPFESVIIMWRAGAVAGKRDVILCCDCRAIALSPGGFRITVTP